MLSKPVRQLLGDIESVERKIAFLRKEQREKRGDIEYTRKLGGAIKKLQEELAYMRGEDPVPKKKKELTIET